MSKESKIPDHVFEWWWRKIISPTAPSAKQFQFSIGDSVEKVGGDYRFDGIVVAAFKKLSGMPRYVVEDDRGILHIYSDKNLKKKST